MLSEYFSKKEYRTFKDHANIKIKVRFNIFTWKKYYRLYELSCSRLGNQTSFTYYYVQSSSTIFGFKKFLKEEGHIVNLVEEYRIAEHNYKLMPIWFKNIINESK